MPLVVDDPRTREDLENGGVNPLTRDKILGALIEAFEEKIAKAKGSLCEERALRHPESETSAEDRYLHTLSVDQAIAQKSGQLDGDKAFVEWLRVASHNEKVPITPGNFLAVEGKDGIEIWMIYDTHAPRAGTETVVTVPDSVHDKLGAEVHTLSTACRLFGILEKMILRVGTEISVGADGNKSEIFCVTAIL